MVIEQSHLIEQGAAMYILNMHNPRHHHHRHHHHHHVRSQKMALQSAHKSPRISENDVDVLDKNEMIQDVIIMTLLRVCVCLLLFSKGRTTLETRRSVGAFSLYRLSTCYFRYRGSRRS